MEQWTRDKDGQITAPVPGVSIFPITQATAATFTDLFIGLTFLCFIRTGTKRVVCPVHGEMTGEEGDLLIFPPGSMVTLENRPLPDRSYRADGVYFAPELVESVFADQPRSSSLPGIIRVREASPRPFEIFDLVRETLERPDLPPPIRQHRLLEPLIWLRHHGIMLQSRGEEQPWSKVRSLIETDVSKPWRITDVARHFAMSEATFRRHLGKSGTGFAQILLNTRLERGLAMLQTTEVPISRVALECGFKTPSHFSDSFRKRFGIKPKLIRSVEV